MADDAFALSPIHARASLPTDGDYDAICEAFMETSRGRWFLTEYARRNRNADTRMVLEAIERLEQNLASQKQAQAEAPAQTAVETQAEAAPTVDLWPELAKAFTKARIEIAQRLVRESNEQAYEAIRSSVETIRSVSWALRERGFDARICDFFDLQVNAITDGYTGLMAEASVADETEAEVLAAFDALIEHVEGLTKTSDPETEHLDAVVDAVADAMNEDDDPPVQEAAEEEITTMVIPPPPEPATTTPVAIASETDAAFREIYGDDGDIEIVEAPAPEETVAAAPTEPEINRQRLFEAKIEPYQPPQGAATGTAPITAADDIEIIDTVAPEPLAREEPTPRAAAPVQAVTADPPARQHAATPERAPTPQPAPPQPAAAQASGGPPSLGQALLDSGVIAGPAGRSDPLAPFRRMSQAEKIAFFT
jgi:hypothetical protein